MKRFLSITVTCCLLASLVGCCQRNRCCRSTCDPCGGGGGGFGMPGAMPYNGGYGPSGQIINQTYGSATPAQVNGPVASTTTPAPIYTQSAYAPQTAALPLNPLPTF
jgi:hypothetical protein